MPLAPVRQGHEWDALSRLDEPLRWRKPRTVFVASDLFHESLPDKEIARVLAVMALCPQHTFMVLTERPKRMLAHVRRIGAHDRGRWPDTHAKAWPLPNVYLGVRVEDQKTADERIPLLLATPAAFRLVLVERLLGPILLDDPPRYYLGSASQRRGMHDGLDGVIVGERVSGLREAVWTRVIVGERGSGLREAAWARSLTEQCKAAGVKCWGVRSPRARKE